MGVDVETFRQLVPRYKDPERTLDYINSLRAEYAAKLLMEHSDCSMDDMPKSVASWILRLSSALSNSHLASRRQTI